jgi:hypothetical protein
MGGDTWKRWPLLPATVACAVFLASPVARAQGVDSKADAASSFRDASAAFDRGDYVAAARSFEASHRAIPRAAAIYDAALSWDAAHDEPRAADDYDTALTKTDLHGSEAEKARQRLRDLEAKLGVVEISGPDGSRVTLAQVAAATLPLRVHLPPGHYQGAVDFPAGAHEAFSIDVQPGVRMPLRIHPPAEQSSPAAHPMTPETPGPSTRSSTSRNLGWILLGSGVAFGGAAVGLGLETLSALDRFRASGDRDSTSRDQALTLRASTDVAWGVAAACAVGGAGLLLTTLSRTSPSDAAAISFGPTGVAIRGTF